MFAQAVHIFGYEHVLCVDLWCSVVVIVPSIFSHSSLCNDVYLYVTGRLPPCLILVAADCLADLHRWMTWSYTKQPAHRHAKVNNTLALRLILFHGPHSINIFSRAADIDEHL